MVGAFLQPASGFSGFVERGVNEFSFVCLLS